VRDLAAMRAAALEAFEASVEELLRGLADEVLARELAFAPADVGALVTRALAAFAAHEPVAVVLCATNAELLHGVALPLRVDSSLGDGDVVIEVRGGKLESPLAFRLQTILERALGYEAA